MNILVIDTSVLVKWLNQDNELYLDKADKILDDVRNKKAELIAPELAKYEIGNVLLFSKKLAPDEAKIPLTTLYSLPITFIIDSQEIAEKTYSIAKELQITYYDASFLAIAKRYNATLITDNIKHQGKSPDHRVIALKDY